MHHPSQYLILGLYLAALPAWPAKPSVDRYTEIRGLIQANRHWSGHFVKAVDARTIKAVRHRVGPGDIPVLLRLLDDRNYGVASAASGLLATLGQSALPALEATAGGTGAAASQAQDALRLIEACNREPARMNPDVCPADARPTPARNE